MGWLVNFAISIMNMEKSKEEETIRIKMEEEIEDAYMKDKYELVLKAKAEKLNKILSVIKKSNGEK